MNEIKEEYQRLCSTCEKIGNQDLIEYSDVIFRRCWEKNESEARICCQDTLNEINFRDISRSFKSCLFKQRYKTKLYFPYNIAKSRVYSNNRDLEESDVLVPFVPFREDYQELLCPIVNNLRDKGYTTTLFLPKHKNIKKIDEMGFDIDQIVVGDEVVHQQDITKAKDDFEKIKPDVIQLSNELDQIKYNSLVDLYIHIYLQSRVFRKVLDQISPSVVFGLHFISTPGYLYALKQMAMDKKPQIIFIQHAGGPGVSTNFVFHDFKGADKVILWGEESKRGLMTNTVIQIPENIILGNPKLQVIYNQFQSGHYTDKEEIDVLYASTMAEEYTKKGLSLFSESTKNMTTNIKYKPHPVFREKIYYRDLKIDQSKVERKKSVYDLIYKSKVVVGTQSTVLLEAVALGTPVVQIYPEFSDVEWNKNGLASASSREELKSLLEKLIESEHYREDILNREQDFVGSIFQNLKSGDVVKKIGDEVESHISL